MPRKQTPDTFWSKVNITCPQDCWEWRGVTNRFGYGRARWCGKKYVAHRVAAWLSGMISALSAPKDRKADGFVLHKCDNPKCCNPGHLFVGTQSDNQRDAYKKGRRVSPRGENAFHAKLTQTEAMEIREKYASGEFQKQLAIQYGVSQQCISNVVSGRVYI